MIVKVRAVGYHMALGQWGYPRQISIINLLTRCAQLPNDIADLDRVPHQDRVRQQTQTARGCESKWTKNEVSASKTGMVVLDF